MSASGRLLDASLRSKKQKPVITQQAGSPFILICVFRNLHNSQANTHMYNSIYVKINCTMWGAIFHNLILVPSDPIG